MTIANRLMGSGVAALAAQETVGSVTSSATATGTTQTDALTFDTAAIYVTTTPSGSGVRLFGNAIRHSSTGDEQTVHNYGANALNVYPPVGETIQGFSANAPLSVSTSSTCTFKKVDPTTWICKETYTASGTGAVSTDLQTKVRRDVPQSPEDRGSTGVDDTTAIQNCVNDGRQIHLVGPYVITSEIDLTTAAAHGLLVSGNGPQSGAGTGTNKTVIRPSSAVSAAFKIDGSGISLAIQNCRFKDFTVDMTNMSDASSSIAFRQMSAYGITYENVHTINEGSNKRSWKFETGSFTTTLINCRGTIVELAGTSLGNAVTTTNIIGCDFVSIPFSYVVGLNIYGGQLNGTADKITGSNINGLTVIGVDVEGASGNFLNFGSTCAHILCQGNEFSGFSGTYSTGTPTKYALLDYQAGFSTGGNNVTFNDGKLSVINSAAALCRQLIQASNGTSQQVDIELKNANGSTFIGQNATGDTTLDARGTGVISFQQSGTTRLGVDGSAKLVIGTLTQTTVGAAGGASALPATPSGYARFKIGSSEFVLPYYAQA